MGAAAVLVAVIAAAAAERQLSFCLLGLLLLQHERQLLQSVGVVGIAAARCRIYCCSSTQGLHSEGFRSAPAILIEPLPFASSSSFVPTAAAAAVTAAAAAKLPVVSAAAWQQCVHREGLLLILL